MLAFLLVLLVALAFEYINGFHDAANAIATVVLPVTALLGWTFSYLLELRHVAR